MILPEANQIYRHFKGNRYRIITLAEDSETGEPMVVYEALYDIGKVYVRPLASFMSKVDREKYPNSEQEYRFCAETDEAQTSIAEAKVAQSRPEIIVEQPEPQVMATQSESRIMAEQCESETLDEEVDPKIMEFLEADGCREKMNVLQWLKEEITVEQLTTIAVSLDMELPEGSIEEQFDSVKNALMIRSRFEDSRLR